MNKPEHDNTRTPFLKQIAQSNAVQFASKMACVCCRVQVCS